MSKLPLFYFKPTICWVDDDQLFLDAATSVFNKQYPCLSFRSAVEAKAYFDAYHSPLSDMSFKQELTESESFGMSKHFPVDIDFSSIEKLISIEEKKDEIAILIVDYHMGEMDGIELCRQLKNFRGKKVLLTGEATSETAIEAFNSGLIDKFIRKSVNSVAILQEYIDTLAYQYFCGKTDSLVAHLESSRPSIFSDSKFVEFFQNWCNEQEIVEYYLINKQGSFVVKDKAGATRYFVVQNEDDNRWFAELHYEATGGMARLVDGVSRGVLIPFFGANRESWQVADNEWPSHFYPAQLLQGRQKYYWAVVADQ